MLRASSLTRDDSVVPFDIIVLNADERHLRRRVLTLQHGDQVLVDLPQAARLKHGDRLLLDDGRHVEVIAAGERLLEIRAANADDLARLAWRLGNSHTPTDIGDGVLRIQYDHVLREMLLSAGAQVREIEGPFDPDPGLTGERHHHGHGHDHGRDHDHPHDHSHAHHHGHSHE